MLTTEIVPVEQQQESLLPPGTTDEKLIAMWLNKGKRSPHTQDAYRRDIGMFLDFLVGTPLRLVTVAHMQNYAQTLVGKPATKNRRMVVVKSLFTYAHSRGYLKFNVGKELELEDVPSSLAERILSETQVSTIIALEPSIRNRTILRLLYYSGLRVSELCNLTWDNLIERNNDQGQLHILAKVTKAGTSYYVPISGKNYYLCAKIAQSQKCLYRETDTEREVDA